MLGTKGDDGVFRYEPPKDDSPATTARAGDIDDDVADWFDGTSAAEVAAAVREVEREAAVTIEEQDAARTASYRERELPSGPERPAVGPPPAGPGRPSGQQPPQVGNYPTQGYPGRDAPGGPPPGYQQPGYQQPGYQPPGYRQPDAERPGRPDLPPPGYPPYQPPQPGER
jgi:hypothetical protein